MKDSLCIVLCSFVTSFIVSGIIGYIIGRMTKQYNERLSTVEMRIKNLEYDNSKISARLTSNKNSIEKLNDEITTIRTKHDNLARYTEDNVGKKSSNKSDTTKSTKKKENPSNKNNKDEKKQDSVKKYKPYKKKKKKSGGDSAAQGNGGAIQGTSKL